MPTPDDTADDTAPPGITLLAAVALQDHLNMVGSDLDRLQGLLADACASLLAGFHGAHAALLAADADAPGVARAIDHLGDAVVALQFQDIASQLIAHSHHRLRSCADRLACDALPDDDDGPGAAEPPPQRANPVAQHQMSAGSVELF